MTLFLTGSRCVGKSTALRWGLSVCNRPIIGLITRFGALSAGQRALYLLPWRLLEEREVADDPSAPVCACMSAAGKTVYPAVFDAAGAQLLQDAAANPEAVIVLDELGFLEREAAGFRDAVTHLLQSGRTVVGVVREGLGAWSTAPFDTLWTVTEENRKEIAENLKTWIQKQNR